MTQKDSTLIRIGRDLKFKLEQLGMKWQQLAEGGRTDVPYNPDGQRISLDAIIRQLLERDEEHRMRSRKNSGPKTGSQGPWDTDGRASDRKAVQDS